MPLYLLLLASGLKHLARRPWQLIPALLIFPLLIISLQNYYFNPAFAKEDWRSIGRYMEKNLQTPGTMVFHKSWLKAPLNYYFPVELITYSLPDATLPPDSPQLQEIKQQLSQYPKVWLIWGIISTPAIIIAGCWQAGSKRARRGPSLPTALFWWWNIFPACLPVGRKATRPKANLLEEPAILWYDNAWIWLLIAVLITPRYAAPVARRSHRRGSHQSKRGSGLSLHLLPRL